MALFDEFKKKGELDRKAIDALSKPALHICESVRSHDFSKFGGPPDVPKAFEWPVWNGRPLAFLLQLRLSDINKEGYLPDLPTSGLLYVFYDEEQSTWGFDPKDEGSWRVMFFEETGDLKMRRYPKDLETRYKEKYVCAKPIVTYPPMEDERICELLGSDEKLDDMYYDLRDSVYEEEVAHHLGGYCDPVQGADMDWECQLASNGIYCGDETDYDDERAKELLAAGAGEWVLLLQIDSDDDTEMIWGDMGSLYFWIRRSDLREKRFDKVWMILQCG